MRLRNENDTCLYVLTSSCLCLTDYRKLSKNRTSSTMNCATKNFNYRADLSSLNT